MKSILIVSTEKHIGKSVLCLSIGLSLKEKGIRFSYMKPISYEVSYETGEPIDRDAEAIRAILGLADPLKDIAPVPLEGPVLREAIEAGDRGFRKRIVDSFNRLKEGRQVALIEGRHHLGLGISAGLSDVDLAQLFDADVLILTRYDGEEAIDRILCALRLLDAGPRILGVVFKEVSMDTQFDLVNDVFVPFLADRGAEVLGIIPYDHRLLCVSVDEIQKRLGGTLVTSASTEQTVSHFLIGAMGPEEALRRFRRTPELAVITGGDLTEIQTIALRVPSVRCLILTGNIRPDRKVIATAEAKKVPVIVVGQHTMAAAELCGELLTRSWIRRGEALDYAINLFRTNIDVDRIIEKATDH
jgi:hypothetical protein